MGTAQFLALATLNVNAFGKRYNTDAKSVDWALRTLSRTASLSGVKSVGTSSVMVVSSNNPSEWIRFPGKPYNGEHNDVDIRDVSAGYSKHCRPNWCADASSPIRTILRNQRS